jgi:hypothetical protein
MLFQFDFANLWTSVSIIKFFNFGVAYKLGTLCLSVLQFSVTIKADIYGIAVLVLLLHYYYYM